MILLNDESDEGAEALVVGLIVRDHGPARSRGWQQLRVGIGIRSYSRRL